MPQYQTIMFLIQTKHQSQCLTSLPELWSQKIINWDKTFAVMYTLKII